MIIEIHGAGFQNKGAELMLRTVVSKLKGYGDQFVPAIDPTYGAYESRCELKLHQIFPARSHVGTPGYSQRLSRQKLFANLKVNKIISRLCHTDFANYGCVGLSDIEALIDISGFAYSDEWGSQPTQDFAKLTSYHKANGKPVILLPQAFGPFDRDETKTAFRKIVENCSLIFARDRVSYQHILNLGLAPENVSIAPDITLFYPEIQEFQKLDLESYNPQGSNFQNPDLQNPDRYACIIPNARMFDQGSAQWSEKYEPYLIQIAQTILERGIKVYIVVHDSSGADLPIAGRLIEKLASSEVSLLTESNPIALKNILGQSMMVIGSRYHGLVASFAKGVPAMALGWSHKYAMLFKDFGCEQFLVSHDTPVDGVLERVEKLANRDENLYLRNQIQGHLQAMQSENQKMWNLVFHSLAKR